MYHKKSLFISLAVTDDNGKAPYGNNNNGTNNRTKIGETLRK